MDKQSGETEEEEVIRKVVGESELYGGPNWYCCAAVGRFSTDVESCAVFRR